MSNRSRTTLSQRGARLPPEEILDLVIDGTCVSIDVMKRLASRSTWWHKLPHKSYMRSTPQRERPAMDHIGIDVHKKESQICILAEEGELIEQRIRTEPACFAAVCAG